MTFLKRALLFVIIPFFSFLLLVLAIDFAVVRSVGDPDKIKGMLTGNEVYEKVIPELLDQANKSAINREGGSGDLSLADPAVHAAAKEAFSPEFVKKTTETIIDSIFRWLEGETPLPDFSIDLTQTKAIFANAAATKAEQRAASLPACPRGGQPSTNDPFKAECLPRGTTPATVAAQTKTETLNNPDFLKDPVITAESIKSKGSDKSVFAGQWADAPGYYQKFKASPWLIGLSALGLAAAIVYLSATRLKGLRHIGIILVAAGITMFVIVWGTNKLINEQVPKLTLDKGVLRDKFHSLIKDVTQDLNGNFAVFGGVYAALGAVAIGGSLFLHRRGPKELKADAKPESTAAGHAPNDPKGSPKPGKSPKK